MEGGIELKQNYLRTEILDKGYDAEVFLEFICLKKGEEGANLDLWSFQELKEVNLHITIGSK
jgi:hypothetical protein